MEADRVKHLLDLKEKEDWEDWRFQLKKSPKSIPELLELAPELKKTIGASQSIENASKIVQASEIFRFSATPYYLSLINPDNPKDPILKQILPDGQELNDPYFEDPDPLKEEIYSPIPGLIHRYQDRVLLYTTDRCAVYCRFCTRKRKLLEKNPEVDFEPALTYIHSHHEILEVILSGGDPLYLSDSKLDWLLGKLKNIKHLVSIRIHSRMPVVLPMRFTDPLIQILETYSPLTLVAHFNHADEITDETAVCINSLRRAGVTVLNQTVLLKNINDTPEDLKKLFLSLIRIGVKPYYLHQCDEVRGVSHFKTDIRTGQNILQELWGKIPGIAIPRLVIDLPDGGGKKPIL